MITYNKEDKQSDFRWFIENYDLLYQKYGHKFFAIRNKTILGIYDDFDKAITDNVSTGLPVGAFIVQECTGDESAYTVYIASWPNCIEGMPKGGEKLILS